jgi:hypothetical protein
MSLEISVLFCKAIIDDKYLRRMLNYCYDGHFSNKHNVNYSGMQLHVKMPYLSIGTKQLQSTRKSIDISLRNIIAQALTIIVTVTNYLLMRD